MRVFVKNLRNQPLMPCKLSKARKLLRNGKAKIVGYKPFTIQLLYATGETTQESDIGIDLGAKNVGVAIQSQSKIIAKGEIELRSDIKANLDTRRTYRKNRRYRKTRYRKPRFNNRVSSRKNDWLPPSVQSRIESTFRWIDRFCNLLPDPNLHLEVGKFDVQKMLNPDINGIEYQQGDAYGYYNVRYYVFARNNYTCQVCKKKGKILQTHHVIYESHGGSNRASNLITVCIDCHTHGNHQPGNIFWHWMQNGKKLPTYKEPTFMNIIRKRIFSNYPAARITYGSETVQRRKELNLDKTHYNDAVAITGISSITKDADSIFKLKQFRKKKRSLHESVPRKGLKQPNTEQRRNSKNTKRYKDFCLNDKVRSYDKVGFISGFTSGGAYVKNIDGDYITKLGKTYKQVPLRDMERVCRNSNWQFISCLRLT